MSINIGDIVYIICNSNGVFDAPVKCIVRYKNHNATVGATVFIAYEENNPEKEYSFGSSDMGITVFKTKEKADKELPAAKFDIIETFIRMVLKTHNELQSYKSEIINRIGFNFKNDELNNAMLEFFSSVNDTTKDALVKEVKRHYGIDVDEDDTAEWLFDPNGMDWGMPAWCCSSCGSKNDNLGTNKNINPYTFAGGHFCPCCGKSMKNKGTDAVQKS